uniref:Beta-ig-h3 fasciclin n=1 Tax=Tetraselmis sp. GSL018 TaxID=582737 RepID=A0A061RF41_9CHLO|eukprot:CAMPEP_0177588726 /NCGR_PEP_ID=MMETSP0419_2-20121207/6386_1 /TAXON_ID=582737 /ORGANISM="Tetraselmis sp., Strain GSL018" /LENGTH=303 /DNA_ID=CAMNT_0019078957 /DNA_START=64 /DNA_END=975 /DNA_ORIENTATION=+
MKLISSWCLMLALLFVQTHGQVTTEAPLPETVVDVAIETDGFGTLVSALTRADLVGALRGDGPFTVFAPTDAAFEALGISPEDLETTVLADVLKYHVVAGRVLSSDISPGPTPTLLEGSNITLSTADGGVTVTGGQGTSATVTQIRDVEAGNGVVHVIGAVLLPPTVLEIVVSMPALQKLETSLNASQLNATLSNGTFTVFAPNEQALADVESIDKAILENHVVTSRVNLTNGTTFTTLARNELSVGSDQTVEGTGYSAKVVETIHGYNGYVYVIDGILSESSAAAHCSILFAVFAAMRLAMA